MMTPTIVHIQNFFDADKNPTIRRWTNRPMVTSRSSQLKSNLNLDHQAENESYAVTEEVTHTEKMGGHKTR